MRASASVLSLSALVFIFALSVGARQEGKQRAIDPSGFASTQTYDSSGGFVAVTDSRGKTTHAGQNPANATDSSAEISTQVPTASMSATSAPITIHVPADQPTIQAAIDAANSGDTVLVADGTYKEDINFNGKAITVTSVHGASKTTIDGGGANTVALFVTSETAASVLNGFTITNGFAGFQAPNFGEGGGISVSGSSPTITNNVIRANKACNGAGIGVGFGGPLVQGNVISNNAQGGCSGGIGGGGISVRGASGNTRIIGNLIASNSMPSGGGGISLFAAGAPIIENNIIQGNDGGGTGAALSCSMMRVPRLYKICLFAILPAKEEVFTG